MWLTLQSALPCFISIALRWSLSFPFPVDLTCSNQNNLSNSKMHQLMHLLKTICFGKINKYSLMLRNNSRTRSFIYAFQFEFQWCSNPALWFTKKQSSTQIKGIFVRIHMEWQGTMSLKSKNRNHSRAWTLKRPTLKEGSGFKMALKNALY